MLSSYAVRPIDGAMRERLPDAIYAHRAPIPEEEPLPGEDPDPEDDEPAPHPDPVRNAFGAMQKISWHDDQIHYR